MLTESKPSSGESYRTLLKMFKEMTEKIWLREWQPPLPFDDEVPPWVAQGVEDQHAQGAEDRRREKSLMPMVGESRQERLHVKWTGRRPGVDERRVAKRIVQKSIRVLDSEPSEKPSLIEELADAAKIAPIENWDDACFLADAAIEDVFAFGNIRPTRTQQKILYGAALLTCSDLTENAISNAFGVSEKTLRLWARLLDRYDRAAQAGYDAQARLNRVQNR